MYYNIRFKGLQTHDPNHAVKVYRENLGYEPTVILIKPDYPVCSEHPLLVRSVAGTAVMMLLTHEISFEEVLKTEEAWHARQSEQLHREFGQLVDRYSRDRKKEDISLKSGNHYAHPKKPYCPHCGELVRNYEDLGWWWGWEYGREPDYWGELRLYVFRRDDYTCFDCKKVYPAYQLNAHHIQPKEAGGIDGARNLRTLCVNCHPDGKPIFEEVEV